MSVFVVGVVASEVAAVVARCARLGLADAGPEMGPLDEEMTAAVGDHGLSGRDLRALVSRARREMPAQPWVYGAPSLSVTLPLWREAMASTPTAVVVNSTPASLCRHFVARGRRTEAVALALWERSVRQTLEALAGLATFVMRPYPSALDQLARFVSTQGLDMADGEPLPMSGDETDPEAAWASTLPWQPQQDRLQALLQNLEGSHVRFATPELGRESPSTAALIEAERCYERQRGELERSLANAVHAVHGMAPKSRSAPPPFEPAYGLDAAEDLAGYTKWRKAPRRRSPSQRDGVGHDLPLLGLTVAVNRPEADLLERCLASIMAQSYPAWRLYIGYASGTGGTPAVPEDVAIAALLTRLAADDERIVVTQHIGDGVSVANAAAGLAGSEIPFLAFVNQHDELEPSALASVAEALALDPEIDLLYTDEDEIDETGAHCRPRFKPDWSPDLLLSTMYVGQLLVVRRVLFEALGGLRPELAGSEHYDLALRVTERARRVVHVPEITYHRRAFLPATNDLIIAATTATDIKALEDAVERRGEKATVGPGLCPASYRVRRAIVSAPLVSIIVPFRDGAELLRRCADSLDRTAGYDHWELLLIDNQSWEPETTAVLRHLRQDRRCRVIDFPHPFNWSAVNNLGARHAKGALLLLLNSDVEGIGGGWLAAMVEHAQRPEVGAVGARLLYPDGRVQHAGVVMGLGGNVAWHAFCKCPPSRAGYLNHAKVIRNFSAVTGACMLVRRDAFEAVGGLDESLAVCFNDVELCLQLRAQGWLVVYTPFAELVHYESSTRGLALDAGEIDIMRRRWGPMIENDPYFNPNLDPRRAEFALPR